MWVDGSREVPHATVPNEGLAGRHALAGDRPILYYFVRQTDGLVENTGLVLEAFFIASFVTPSNLIKSTQFGKSLGSVGSTKSL